MTQAVGPQPAALAPPRALERPSQAAERPLDFSIIRRLFACTQPYQRLRNYPLTVYVGQDLEAVLRGYSRERALLLGAGAIGTLLLAALAVRRIRRPRLAVRQV